jgi:quinol-cytochrome oxidoreductase complex cytochrome b subunit
MMEIPSNKGCAGGLILVWIVALPNPIKECAISQVSTSFSSFIKHIHPIKIPLKALELKTTWALGGLCLVLVMILMGTGMLMLLTYQPFPELAYGSVQALENQFIFGRMIRSMHYFAANLLVILISCHVLRVFFTGGYQGKRKVNWIIGVCILSLVLLSCFTGYLLPWDQTAFWAVTICINMFDYVPAGSFLKGLVISPDGVSGKTLQLFFTLHTSLIPATLILLLATHFWKIRKARGVVIPGQNSLENNDKPPMVKTNPNLLLREGVAALVLLALVMVLALFFDAPLDAMANAGLSPNPAKAPWYFSGFQELLLHFHPFVAVFIIPALLFSLLLYLPFKPGDTQAQGVWFISDTAKKAGKTALIFSVILTPVLILLDEYAIDFQALFPGIPPMVSTGALPFAIIFSLVLVHHFGMKKKYKLNPAEAFQTSAIFMVTAFILLTLTCAWLRGAGMKLIIGGA